MKTILFAVFLSLPASVFAQWTPDFKVSSDTGARLNENMGRCLAVSGDSVYAVWCDNSAGASSIFYANSFDGGATWSAPIALAGASKSADFPSIAVSGELVNIAYRDDSTSWYERSTDGGQTWQPRRSLGNFYWWPSITCDGRHVFVALNSNVPGNSEVWFRRSMDGGETWDSIVRVSNALGRSEDPSIAASDGHVYLVWNDNRDSLNGAPIMQAYGRISSDNGTTWGPETLWNKPPTSSYFPVVHALGTNVDFAWGDRRGMFEVFYKYSTDHGTSWSNETQLSIPGSTAAYPVLARSGPDVHIVWWYFGGAVVYRHSSDGGATWGPETDLVPVASTPGEPFIETGPNALHLLWQDHRDGYSAIYYKREATNSTALLPDTLIFSVHQCGVLDTSFVIENATLLPEKILSADKKDTTILPPGVAQTVPVTLIGSKPGSDTSVLYYTVVDDTAVPTVVIETVSNAFLPFSFSDSAIDLGTVDSGMTIDTFFTIENIGCDTLSVDAELGTENGFSIHGALSPFLIEGGNYLRLLVQFRPVRLGTVKDSLVFNVDDEFTQTTSRYSVLLQAHVVAAPSAAVIGPGRTAPPIEITPNPSQGTAMLHLELSSPEPDVRIHYFDAAGRSLGEQTVGNLSAGRETISLALPRIHGLVFASISSDGRSIAQTSVVLE